jgi:hypothetical protein
MESWYKCTSSHSVGCRLCLYHVSNEWGTFLAYVSSIVAGTLLPPPPASGWTGSGLAWIALLTHLPRTSSLDFWSRQPLILCWEHLFDILKRLPHESLAFIMWAILSWFCPEFSHSSLIFLKGGTILCYLFWKTHTEDNTTLKTHLQLYSEFSLLYLKLFI